MKTLHAPDKSFSVEVYAHGPLALPAEAMHEYGIELSSWEDLPVADGIVLAVAHKEYLERPLPDYY
jgi:UDP-N-acetyl-D-galactosamine dehydrogenase